MAELLEDFATRAECTDAVPFDRAVPSAASLLGLAPPGTGKTRVLAAVAVALAAMGFPVALAAPSRTARDLLLTVYREALADMPLTGNHRRTADAATPTALTLPQAYMRDRAYPDGATLILDEVSMATLPALIAAGRDASRVVADGDLWQLGPVVEGPTSARVGQCVPPFGVALTGGRHSPALVRLRHSRRMPAVVADVMRALAYEPDGPLGHRVGGG